MMVKLDWESNKCGSTLQVVGDPEKKHLDPARKTSKANTVGNSQSQSGFPSHVMRIHLQSTSACVLFQELEVATSHRAQPTVILPRYCGKISTITLVVLVPEARHLFRNAPVLVRRQYQPSFRIPLTPIFTHSQIGISGYQCPNPQTNRLNDCSFRHFLVAQPPMGGQDLCLSIKSHDSSP